MKNNKLTIAIITFVIGLCLFFYMVNIKNKSIVQKISVGAILPLTGEAGLLGKEVKEGMEIALEENYNSQYSVVFEDSKNDAKTGVSVFNKLKDHDKTNVFVGSMSSVCSAIIPLADKTNSLFFATVTAKPNLTKQSSNSYRLYYTNDVQGEAVVSYISKKLAIDKIAVIYTNDDYGVSGLKYLKDFEAKYSYEIVAGESIEKGSTTVGTQVSKISRSGCGAIIVVAYGNPLIEIIKKIRELNVSAKIFTYTGIANPEIINSLGSASNDIYLSIGDFNPFEPQNDLQKNFFKKIKDKFNKAPSHYHAFGYDLMKIIILVTKESGGDIEKSKNMLNNLQYKGLLGNLKLDSNHEFIFPQKIMKIENGKFINID